MAILGGPLYTDKVILALRLVAPLLAMTRLSTTNSDGSRLFVSTYNEVARRGGSIIVLDAATDTISSIVVFETVPQSLVVAPDGSQLFATHVGGLGLSFVDLSSATITSDFPIDGLPAGLALLPDGSQLYLAVGVAPGRLLTIDALSGTVTRSATLAGTGQGVAVSPDGSRVYVAHRSDGERPQTHLEDLTLANVSLCTSRTSRSRPGF